LILDYFSFYINLSKIFWRSAIKNLAILVRGNADLFNFINMLPVNPKKFPKVNYKDTIMK